MAGAEIIEYITESDGTIVVFKVVVGPRTGGGNQNWQNIQSVVDRSVTKLNHKIWKKYNDL